MDKKGEEMMSGWGCIYIYYMMITLPAKKNVVEF
jgi:hypothetical protein